MLQAALAAGNFGPLSQSNKPLVDPIEVAMLVNYTQQGQSNIKGYYPLHYLLHENSMPKASDADSSGCKPKPKASQANLSQQFNQQPKHTYSQAQGSMVDNEQAGEDHHQQGAGSKPKIASVPVGAGGKVVDDLGFGWGFCCGSLSMVAVVAMAGLVPKYEPESVASTREAYDPLTPEDVGSDVDSDDEIQW